MQGLRFRSAARRTFAVALPAALALTTAGCLVGPDYEPPQTAVDDAFDAASEAAGGGWTLYEPAEPEAEWWGRMGDPVLAELITRARRANPDLRAAAANVRAAWELLRAERWELRPHTSVAASVSEEEASAVNFPPGVDRETTNYNASFDASWELDLFGRIRRTIEAQAAEYEITLADRRGAFVAIAGEVGRTYLELRGTQGRLAVARANVGNQEQSLELVEALLDAGRGTELELAQARAQLETTRASIPLLEAQREAAIHRLSVLVGEPPRALAELLAVPDERRLSAEAGGAAGPADDDNPPAIPSYLPAVPERIAVGDPAALLRRRPDVAVAERRLAGATARIGIAVADLFPRVSLTGSFGYFANSLDDLGTSTARTTSLGPFLTWAAFDLRGVRARIRAEEANADAALAVYEKAVLLALEDTENALVRLDRARRRQAHLLAAEAAAREAAELARARYRAGLESFLAVLDSEARLLAAQDALAESATATATAFVVLYEALGGGWEGGEEEIGVPVEPAAGT